MGKIMRNDVEYGGGSGGGGDVSQLEQRVERLEDSVDDLDRYKVTQLTFNTGIDIGDWDRVIDPDEPVVYERYTNYHDAVAKLSQQIDIMGERTDDLKTSLNELETDLIYKFSVVYGYNGNLNDLPAFSVAECLNSCTNLPFGALHSTVITIRMASNSNFAHQLCISGAIGHDRNTNFMAIRTKWSGSWGNWVTIK